MAFSTKTTTNKWINIPAPIATIILPENTAINADKKLAHRITMGHIVHELVHAFTHADKGFFHLLLQLFLRPGIVAREYVLENKRKRYFMPFQYLLIIGAIATFVAVNSHFMEHTVGLMSNGMQYSEKQQRMMKTITDLQSKYYNFIILLQLPFYALGSFIVYRKQRLNFAEHLTMQTFITAQSTIISMCVMLVVAITGKPGVYIGASMFLISFAYQAYAYVQFFRQQNFKGVLRALLSHLLSFIMFFLCAIIIGIIIGMIISMTGKNI